MKTCRAVFLYGSHARGDADEFSDVDVLAVAPVKPNVDEIVPLLPVSTQGLLHISHYTWEEFDAMSRYGSLFLHHIAAESTALLYEGNAKARISTLLDSLSTYQLAERDLVGFRSMIDDVEEGLTAGLPPCFELSVLGGVARHASVLACYLAGIPTFGRNCITRAVVALGMPEVQRKLQIAQSFRLYEERKCGVPEEASIGDVEQVIEILTDIIDRMEGWIHANTERLPSSNSIHKSISKGS